jgi:plasmid replication initiation protein
MAKLKVQSFAKFPNDYVSVERSRGLSLLEEKVSYMLINAMQKRWESVKKLDKVDFDFIANGEVSFDDFIKTMQIGSVNRKEIGDSLKDLLLFAIGIRTSTKDNFLTMFKQFSADYETNLISYKFNDCFVEYFTGICRDYFKLSIEEVIGLHSTHSIRIYQLLKTKQNMDKKEFEYSIDEIKKQLNIEKKYNRYNHFKVKVLELAKSQINISEASQFNIDYEEIKTGKAVTSIKFHILAKGKNYYQEHNLIAGYKLDQINKHCQKWKKEFGVNDVVHILSDKILAELTQKKPSRAAIANWLNAIATITNQQKLF